MISFPDEGGLGDLELGGNAGEHPALNPEVNETLNSFFVVHTVLSPPKVEVRESV